MSTTTAKSHVESGAAGPTLSVHDPDFRSLVTIPLSEVHHLPPAHLEISRLVLCRKYNPVDPHNSCPMGNSCKFVHANLSHPAVSTQSIHVNYAWRSLDDVTEPRLPAGEMVTVMAPNGRQPVQQVPSEFLLATHGAVTRHESEAPLAHCAHYYFNRMCNRGDRCNFVHAVFVDPNAADWQRAPPRAGAGYADNRPLVGAGAVRTQTTRSAPPMNNVHVPVALPSMIAPTAATSVPSFRFHTHANTRGSVNLSLSSASSSPDLAAPSAKITRVTSDLSEGDHSSCDLSDCEDGVNCRSSICSANGAAPTRGQRVVFVHNPYSLLSVTQSWIEAA